MKRRKKNLYFDRKSLGFKLGNKPATKAERSRQAAIRKQEKREDQLAQRESQKQAKKQAGAQFRQLRSEAKKEARGRELAKSDEALWKELYGSQNPMRVFPGNLTNSEREALRKLVRRSHMATKKRKKRKNPKKGKMPAGLRKYWAKKRAKKKNPAKKKRRRTRRASRPRRRRVNPRPRRRVARKPRRVRRVRRNPPQKRRTLIIKSKFAKGTAGFKADVRAARAKYGKARVL